MWCALELLKPVLHWAYVTGWEYKVLSPSWGAMWLNDQNCKCVQPGSSDFLLSKNYPTSPPTHLRWPGFKVKRPCVWTMECVLLEQNVEALTRSDTQEFAR